MTPTHVAGWTATVAPPGVQRPPRTPVGSSIPPSTADVGLDVTIEPLPGEVTTGFGPHSGKVMTAPRVFSIYWGRTYGSPATGINAKATTLDSFLATVVASRYVDNLAQYGVGAGTFIGSTWVDHSPGQAQTFTMDQIATILAAWLDAGLSPEVPSPDEQNLLFVIFPPQEVTLVDNNGQGGFCGYHMRAHYHHDGDPNLFYAVVDPTGGTSATSHELAEAFTDPALNAWFSDDGDHPEIGDVCSSCGSQTLILNGFSVASYWLANAGRCLQQSDLDGPPATVPALVGLPVAQARSAIFAAGLTRIEQGVFDKKCEHLDEVIEQSPAAGTQLPHGAPVTITVGDKPPGGCPPPP
jgi:hypothetical protein